jgi:hypothetical protein
MELAERAQRTLVHAPFQERDPQANLESCVEASGIDPVRGRPAAGQILRWSTSRVAPTRPRRIDSGPTGRRSRSPGVS